MRQKVRTPLAGGNETLARARAGPAQAEPRLDNRHGIVYIDNDSQ